MFLRLRNSLGIAREFVEADGYGLAKVHRTMLFARGDAQEPMAMAEVFVRKTTLLGTEKKGDAASSEMLAEWTGGLTEPTDRVLRLAAADGGGTDNEGAIRNGFGNGFELFSAVKQWRGANGGTRFAEGQVVGIHDAKMKETEVAHGASGGANVERIAGLDEDNAQVVELGEGRQGSEFTAGEKQQVKRERCFLDSSAALRIYLAEADESLGLQHHKRECSCNEGCFNPIVSRVTFE